MSSRTGGAFPFGWWAILGMGISLLVFVGAYRVLGDLPWNYITRTDVPPHPPQPIDRPWVSGGFAWGLLLLLPCATALVLWLDRGSERRLDPLAMIALCLAILAHGEAIYTANAIAELPDHWPENLVRVSVTLLLASCGVAALAWIRLVLSKQRLRGRMFAICATVCSLGSAGIVHALLGLGWWKPIPNDGIEPPVAYHSEAVYWVDDPRVVLVRADGTTTHPDSPPTDVDRHDPGSFKELVLLRADRRARWSAVRKALRRVQEEGLWKICFSTRWEKPVAMTRITTFLAKEVGVYVPGTEPPPRALVLRVNAEGTVQFDDEPWMDAASLRDRLGQLSRRRNDRPWIRIEPDDDASWGDIIGAFSTASYFFGRIDLGPFALEVL